MSIQPMPPIPNAPAATCPRPPKILLHIVGILAWPLLIWAILISELPKLMAIYMLASPLCLGIGGVCILRLPLPIWLRTGLVLCYALMAVAAFALLGVVAAFRGGWQVR